MSLDEKYERIRKEVAEEIRKDGPVLKLSEVGRKSGNKKLIKTRDAYEREVGVAAEIASFNTVAGKSGGSRGGSCIGAGKCDEWCYAQSGNFTFTKVHKLRVRNQLSSQWLLRKSGVSGLTDCLSSLLVGWILGRQKGSKVPRDYLLRIHDSGDFYSMAYIKAWCDAVVDVRQKLSLLGMQSVRLVPYAYTKSYKLRSGMHLLKNSGVQLVQSLESKWPEYIDWDLPVAATFPKSHEVPDGWVHGNTEEMADLYAILGESRIALPHHGSKGSKKVEDPLMQIEEVRAAS